MSTFSSCLFIWISTIDSSCFFSQSKPWISSKKNFLNDPSYPQDPFKFRILLENSHSRQGNYPLGNLPTFLSLSSSSPTLCESSQNFYGSIFLRIPGPLRRNDHLKALKPEKIGISQHPFASLILQGDMLISPGNSPSLSLTFFSYFHTKNKSLIYISQPFCLKPYHPWETLDNTNLLEHLSA